MSFGIISFVPQCGLQLGSIRVIGNLVRNADSQALSQTQLMKSALHQDPQVTYLYILKFEKSWSERG